MPRAAEASVAAPLEARAALLPRDEREALAPLLATLAATAGRWPEVRATEHGASLRVPTMPWLERTVPVYLRARALFAGRPRSEAYAAALGFFADRDGLVRAVPTPETFRRAVAALGFDDAGYLPELSPHPGYIAPFGPWLRAQCRGALLVSVPRAAWLARTAPLRGSWATRSAVLARRALSQLAGLAHDLGVHALATHLVPRAQAQSFGARAREALAALRCAAGPFAPLPLLRFYEEDLVQHGLRCWRAGDGPEAFVRYAARDEPRDALARAFDARLAQLAAGVRAGLYLAR